MPHLDSYFQFQNLPGQFLEMLTKACDQLAKNARQAIFSILQNLGQSLTDVPNALRDDDAVFSQQATNLVGLRCSRLDEALVLSALNFRTNLASTF